MTVDRDLFVYDFPLDNPPHWKCPHCEKGYLILDKEKVSKAETPKSLLKRKGPLFKEWHAEYLFHVFLLCSKPDCNEVVSLCGELRYKKPLREGAPRGIVTPDYFNPSPLLFSIPEWTDDDVQDESLWAFFFFWQDYAACANKIRSVVERILTDQGVKTILSEKGKKRRKLSLHERIELYEAKEPEVAKNMMAIKWIGNAGSHLDELEMEEILVGFDLLEIVLNELYSDDKPILMATRDEILRKRRPVAY